MNTESHQLRNSALYLVKDIWEFICLSNSATPAKHESGARYVVIKPN